MCLNGLDWLLSARKLWVTDSAKVLHVPALHRDCAVGTCNRQKGLQYSLTRDRELALLTLSEPWSLLLTSDTSQLHEILIPGLPPAP